MSGSRPTLTSESSPDQVATESTETSFAEVVGLIVGGQATPNHSDFSEAAAVSKTMPGVYTTDSPSRRANSRA